MVARELPQGADVARLHALDARIRALTREINRAGVQYGIGKLSRDGYIAIVQRLREERGRLEAERVRRMLGTS